MSLYFVILVSASTTILTYVTLGLATHSVEFDVCYVAAGLSGGCGGGSLQKIFLALIGACMLPA